jgi:hypothetical protein
VTIPIPDRPGFRPFEPHVAVDPENPERVLVGAMFPGEVGQGDKARGASRLFTWQSEDSGRSWSKPAAPFGDSGRPTSRLDADVVVAFGTGKTCWLAGCDYDWHTLKPNYSSAKVCRSEDGARRGSRRLRSPT